jgi:uncharacterized membrane protein HdeD (DUF308 family)
MTRQIPTALLISLFIAMVILVTAIVVVVIHFVTGSWLNGWFTLLFSGVITVSVYPLVFQRKAHPHPRSGLNG